MNRLRGVFTLLNLHLAGLSLLLILDIAVGVKLALAWSAIRSDQSDAFAREQVHYGQLQAQMMHLQGLPKKVDQSGKDAMKFYEGRIAPNYSTVAAELGDLAGKDQVRWTRAEYTHTPVINGLTEVRIDASLSGPYTQLMHFINDLERDKNHVFFTVNGLAFSGQQGGLVNLRLRVITYLRSDATDLPPASAQAGAETNNDSGNAKAEPVSQREVR